MPVWSRMVVAQEGDEAAGLPYLQERELGSALHRRTQRMTKRKTSSKTRKGKSSVRDAGAQYDAIASLSPSATDSEVEAYKFILDQLREHGWSIKNPSRAAEGQVWTQNQCLAHPDVKRALGSARPENIIKLSESRLWVVEAKRSRKDLDLAISEAIDYATRIQRGNVLDVSFVSGVAGNEASGYLVRTQMRVKGKWQVVTINGQPATALLTPSQIDALYRQNAPAIRDYIPPPALFLRTAERINEILHIGGINKNERAKVMASLLLAVVDEPGPNVDADLPVLIEEISSRARHVLRKNGKSEFAPFITIIPPTNSDNHFKYKRALVQTLQELRNLNIKSAMNSSTDVLGQFYEVFLKYGNGAKENRYRTYAAAYYALRSRSGWHVIPRRCARSSMWYGRLSCRGLRSRPTNGDPGAARSVSSPQSLWD